jgi:hypothetical protein
MRDRPANGDGSTAGVCCRSESPDHCELTVVVHPGPGTVPGSQGAGVKVPAGPRCASWRLAFRYPREQRTKPAPEITGTNERIAPATASPRGTNTDVPDGLMAAPLARMRGRSLTTPVQKRPWAANPRREATLSVATPSH